MLLLVFVIGGVGFWVSGFLFGFLFQKKLWWVSLLVNGAAASLIFVLPHWGSRKLEALDKQRRELRRSAEGEISVEAKLKEFPNGFYVVNGLAAQFGDIDHIVVGPTGVFALDAKNWKGVVASDGKGELLYNGQPTDKPTVRNFVCRVMDLKDRVKALAPGLDPYIQAVFVYPVARVEAKWGSTGSVHCMTDDRLYAYIVEDKKQRKLADKEVKAVARAFAALARMDPTFPERTKVPDVFAKQASSADQP